MERLRGGSLRKEEQYEYHIGRLRQDRVHIPRTEGQVKMDECVFNPSLTRICVCVLMDHCVHLPDIHSLAIIMLLFCTHKWFACCRILQ